MFRQSSPSLIAVLFAAINLAVFVIAVDPERSGEPIMEINMHDILGGNNPTGACWATSTALKSPLRGSLGFRPPKNGVAITNTNGAIPTSNTNGIPLGTGLAGTSFAGGNKNGQTVTAQLGPDGLGHGFRTITVIDDFLTSSLELSTQNVGKAQGVYVASSADGSTQMMTFTAMTERGEYGNSLNFFGVYRIGSTMSQPSVPGGTGRFKNACGFAEFRFLIPAGQHVTRVAETLLRITVHLTY